MATPLERKVMSLMNQYLYNFENLIQLLFETVQIQYTITGTLNTNHATLWYLTCTMFELFPDSDNSYLGCENECKLSLTLLIITSNLTRS